MKTTYTPQPSHLSLIAKVLTFGDIQECPADIFIPIDSDYNAHGLSMFINCPILFLDKLVFIGMSHTVNFIGSSRDCFNDDFLGVANPAFVIHSNLKGDRLPLNQYLELHSNAGDDMTVVFGRNQEDFAAVLHSVKVTMFGASFMASAHIRNNALEISGDTSVFKYPARIDISSQISDKIWTELSYYVNGTLQSGSNTFVSRLNMEVSNQLSSMAQSGESREQVASESLDQANEQLAKTEARYNEIVERIQKANETYQAKLLENSMAERNHSEAQITFNDASEELQEIRQQLDRLCTEMTCENMCMRGVVNKVCYRNTFTEKTSTCLQTVTVPKQVKIVSYEIRVMNRYEKRCFHEDYWECYWWGGCCRASRYVCRILCVPYSKLAPISRCCETIQVKEQKSLPCTVQVYESSVPYNCPEVSDCAFVAPSSSCVQANAFCRQAREAALQELEKAQEGIRGPFQDLQVAQNRVSMIRTATSSAKNQLDSAEERERELGATLRNIRAANSMAQQVYMSSLQQIGPFLDISRILADNNNIEDVFNVRRVDFTSEFSTEPPSELSIMLLCKSYNNPTPEEKSSIFFDDLGEESIREIAEEIIEETFVEAGDETGKRKRQSVDKNSNRLIFEERCTHVTNIRLFLLDIQAKLIEVHEDIEAAREIKDRISEEDSNEMDISEVIDLDVLQTEFNVSLTGHEPVEDEVVTSYMELLSTYESSAAEQLASIEQTVLAEWQASMEQVYSEAGSVSTYLCVGFADCLQTSVDQLQNLINLEPESNETLVMELPIAQKNLLRLSLSSNLSIAEALDSVAPIVDIINAYATNTYWCNRPPVITIQTLPELNVSVDGTLRLSCEADSNLTVAYGWKKDGNILPEFTASQLELFNVTRMDAGNYSCFARNPVGSTASISTSVLVYELPTFYLQPKSVVTYYGSNDGARFECNATSWPFPGWNWYYRASADDSWTIIEEEETNELFIEKPQKEHEGWYTCEAFNYQGSIRAEPVSLLLVPFSVAQQLRPLEFGIVRTEDEDNTCSLDDLYYALHREISAIIKSDLVVITDLTVNEIDFEYYAVNLGLASQNVSAYYLNLYFFDEIANLAIPSINSLQQSITLLTERFAKESVNFPCVNGTYTFVPGSLIFDIYTYLCPDGQKLSPSYFLCCEL